MDSFCYPLEKEICDRIEIGFYEKVIRIFPHIEVLDETEFLNKHGFVPDVWSIFIVSRGGSYDSDEFSVLNGSLISCIGVKDLCAVSHKYRLELDKRNVNSRQGSNI
jgi:hypothetical protein